jgi:hypothetical protein
LEEKLSVPTTAQDRVPRGPLAALLILLSLFLGSATAAAGADLRGPATRLGSSRPGSATALLPTAARNSLGDETSGAAAGPSVLPSAPGLVTERLWTRPRAEFPSGAWIAVPKPAGASYRARAPPAS